MADNYLGKKLEEYKSRSTSVSKVRKHMSLNSLLVKNHSFCGYDTSFVVRDEQLRNIIDVNTKTILMCNRQVLRFRSVNNNEGSEILPYIRFGTGVSAAFSSLSETEPNAFIVICSILPENKNIYVDLGISVQSMLLRAVELGLVGFFTGDFDKDVIKEKLKLKYEPLMVIAIGRSAEYIKQVNVQGGDNFDCCCKDNISYDVPHLILDDLIIK